MTVVGWFKSTLSHYELEIIMKKLFTVLFVSVVLGVVTAPADAQPVVVSNRCCDAWGVVRCYQVNFTPVGNPCYCTGLGYGHTC